MFTGVLVVRLHEAWLRSIGRRENFVPAVTGTLWVGIHTSMFSYRGLTQSNATRTRSGLFDRNQISAHYRAICCFSARISFAVYGDQIILVTSAQSIGRATMDAMQLLESHPPMPRRNWSHVQRDSARWGDRADDIVRTRSIRAALTPADIQTVRIC